MLLWSQIPFEFFDLIDRVVSWDNQSAAQSGLKCIIEMLQKKSKNNYEWLKIEKPNVMKK